MKFNWKSMTYKVMRKQADKANTTSDYTLHHSPIWLGLSVLLVLVCAASAYRDYAVWNALAENWNYSAAEAIGFALLLSIIVQVLIALNAGAAWRLVINRDTVRDRKHRYMIGVYSVLALLGMAGSVYINFQSEALADNKHNEQVEVLEGDFEQRQTALDAQYDARKSEIRATVSQRKADAQRVYDNKAKESEAYRQNGYTRWNTALEGGRVSKNKHKAYIAAVDLKANRMLEGPNSGLRKALTGISEWQQEQEANLQSWYDNQIASLNADKAGQTTKAGQDKVWQAGLYFKVSMFLNFLSLILACARQYFLEHAAEGRSLLAEYKDLLQQYSIETTDTPLPGMGAGPQSENVDVEEEDGQYFREEDAEDADVIEEVSEEEAKTEELTGTPNTTPPNSQDNTKPSAEPNTGVDMSVFDDAREGQTRKNADGNTEVSVVAQGGPNKGDVQWWDEQKIRSSYYLQKSNKKKIEEGKKTGKASTCLKNMKKYEVMLELARTS